MVHVSSARESDGKVDLAGYQSANGGIFVHAGTGASFTPSSTAWAALGTGHSRVALLADYFAGDTHIDLGIYDPDSLANDATFSVGHNAQSRFVIHPWAPLTPKADWRVSSCDFTRQNRADVLAYYPADSGSQSKLDVWQNLSAPVGYAWPLSAEPEQKVRFMTSGVFKSPVKIYRYEDDEVEVASVSAPSVVQPYPLPPPLADGTRPTPKLPNGPGWSVTFEFTIPEKWTSGLYAAKLEPKAAGANPFYLTFIVKPEGPASRIAVLANVNTWNAYNINFGGGKYRGTLATSFLRPSKAASPDNENDGHIARAERYVLGWLTRSEIAFDLYTDIDFHNGAVIAEDYDKLILHTHPEYWTPQMRQNLDQFLQDGGSLIYLGGNGIFETVRYEGSDASKAIYQNGQDTSTGTAKKARAQYTFRAGGAPGACFQSNRTKHEINVLGVASGPCLDGVAYAGAPFIREPGTHPIFDVIFAGTSVTQAGRQFGATGHPTADGAFNGAASGHEIDTSSETDADGFVILCGDFPPDPVPPVCEYKSSKPSVVLLAKGCIGTTCDGAHMTYYRHPNGGFVFSAGSITFGRSLAYKPAPDAPDTDIQRIIKNVLNHQ